MFSKTNEKRDNKTDSPKLKQRTIDEKYEIIKYYEKIEKEGRGAKEKTRQKFEISTISSLNVILHHSEEIIRLYESNQSSSSRIRMSQSRFPHVDQHLYQSFSFLRSKNIEVSGLDFMIKASEIKEKLLSSANLSVEDRLKLEKINFMSGFIRGFKNRHNIRLKNLSEEAGSVDEALVSQWFDKVREMISSYDSNCIANADETIL